MSANIDKSQTIAVPADRPVESSSRKRTSNTPIAEPLAAVQPRPSELIRKTKGDAEAPSDDVPLGPPLIEQPVGLWQQMKSLALLAPAWLVSLVLHLLLVVSLTVIMCSPPPQEWSHFIEGNLEYNSENLLEEVVFIPPEMEDLDDQSAAPSGDDLGPTTPADAELVSPNRGDVAMSDLESSPSSIAEGELSSEIGGGNKKSRGGGFMGAEFFGVQAPGKKFVFIVDSSNSMRGSRFAAAKREVVAAVKRLSKDQSFLVMFFDQNTEVMTFAPKKEPELRPVLATPANIKKLERWIVDVQNELHTDPYEAMRMALDILPDAVYLLSDGKLTDKGKTIDFLTTQNFIDDALAPPEKARKTKVIIHTVGFYSREGEETLQFIAKNNGGTYRFVPRPKTAKR